MSFRLFVYYCALCGGWAALVGWLLGVWLAPGEDYLLWRNGVIGMFLGLLIALGLGLVDSLWALSWHQRGELAARVGLGVLVGGVGGLLAGILAQILHDSTDFIAVFIVGWTLLGILCGGSVAAFELVGSIRGKQDRRSARAKLAKCLGGGALGGFVGGLFAFLGREALGSSWRFPTAAGFVALGLCIGLLVGLAQVILKEAWIRVETGFRSGREMILAKEKTSIGRAEHSDIPLFGDTSVAKLHAQIVLDAHRYFVEDNGTPEGTYLNEERIHGRMPLKSGDEIRVGKSVLRFYERPGRG
jgi:hypothetical protein